MAETIYFNGKKYDSMAEMPSSVRQQYEKFNRFFADADQDGLPDIIQSGGISVLKEAFNLIKEVGQMGAANEGLPPDHLMIIRETDTGIYVNGKGYNSVSEMPSNIRQSYEKITNTASEGGDNIYDEAWREVQRDEFFKPHDDEILNRQMTNQPRSENNIEPVESTSRFIFLVIAAILVLGIAVMAWLVFF